MFKSSSIFSLEEEINNIFFDYEDYEIDSPPSPVIQNKQEEKFVYREYERDENDTFHATSHFYMLKDGAFESSIDFYQNDDFHQKEEIIYCPEKDSYYISYHSIYNENVGESLEVKENEFIDLYPILDCSFSLNHHILSKHDILQQYIVENKEIYPKLLKDLYENTYYAIYNPKLSTQHENMKQKMKKKYIFKINISEFPKNISSEYLAIF
jgi:hypothetical protein